MYRRFRRILLPGVLSISLAVASGCNGRLNRDTERPSAQQENRGELDNSPAPEPVWHVKSGSEGLHAPSEDRTDIPLLAIGNQKYVPLRQLTADLELNTEWNASTQTLHMGDNDFPYSITVHAKQAVKNGEAIVLAEAPILYEGSVYLPVSATIDLLHDEMAFETSGDRLVLYASSVRARGMDDPGAPEDDGLNFAEDPNDPFRHAEEAVPNEGAGIPSTASGDMELRQVAANAARDPDSELEAVAAAASAKKVDIDALILKGKQYVGVKYLFGADPYPKTGRFDCSAFTRYVFGKFGIALPRLARQQATLGQSVSRKRLRRGDLLFFYVPGRFKSNRTVGHVGIYIGNNQMLHASPKPNNGVQITNINKAYWKDTFLLAKRIAE